MGKKLDGKGTVAITVGSLNDTEKVVAEEFTTYLNEHYPSITVLDPEEEGFDVPQAIAKASAIIQAHPEITGAFSTTGNGPTTWSSAAKDTGKKIVIISMDYTLPNLDLVSTGDVYMLVGQPLYEECYKAVELLVQNATGTKINYDNYLPAPLITAENAAQYIWWNQRVSR
jgi:ABC-type sugar transport system substrate-binding protein